MNLHDPTVYLVDDDAAVLRGLSRLLQAEGLRPVAFDCPRRFLAEHDPSLPGCAVLDLSMPDVSGAEIQQAISECRSGSVPRQVIFLTGHGDVPTSVHAMKCGAIDFLTKPVDADQLIAAVRQAIEKDRALRTERAGAVDVEVRLARLTPREREVMIGVIAGRLNKQVAADLGTTEKTIKVHRARVMQKMGADSLAELVRLGERAGLRRG